MPKIKSILAADGPPDPGTYALAMSVKDAEELLFISGQIGVDQNGVAPPAFADQARLIWGNIDAQLRAAGMTKDNLVKVTIYLSDRKYTDEYRAAREAYLEGRKIGLTCIICEIFDSSWLMEIEAVAAR